MEVIDMLSKGQYGASDTANTLKRVRNRQTRGYLDDSRAKHHVTKGYDTVCESRLCLVPMDALIG